MASRACGNRLSLRNQYDTKTPRASTFSQGFPPAPAQFDSTGRTELASRKNLQRGFRVDPNFVRVTPKISSNLGTEKISRDSRITAGPKLPEAARVFSNVSPAGVGRKPSWRTGSRNALEFLPDRRLSGFAKPSPEAI